MSWLISLTCGACTAWVSCRAHGQAPHKAKPPEECLTCRRLGEPCHRHGGRSRSTAFRGATGTAGYCCTRCRWPSGKGHAPTCPLVAT